MLSHFRGGVGFTPGLNMGDNVLNVSDSLGRKEVIEVLAVHVLVVGNNPGDVLANRLEPSLKGPPLGAVIELVGQFKLDLVHASL